MQARFAWLLIIFGLGGSGFGLWHQSELHEQLRSELIKLREMNGELGRLREDNRTLTLGQPSVAEQSRLRDGHDTIPELRAEIEGLQASVRIAEEKLAAAAVERFAPGRKVPATEWKNAGSETWKATLETVLWAAAGGDVDTFAGNLLLSDRTRTEAIALLASLPSTLRAQLGTPEKLIAFLATRDVVSLGTAELIEQAEFQARSGPTVHASVQMTDADGKAKDLRLRLSRKDDQWKLVVPDKIPAKYLALLKSPPMAPDPK